MRLCSRTSEQPAHISVTRRRSALPRGSFFASIPKHNAHPREREWSLLTTGHSISTIQRLELTPALLLVAGGDRGAVGRDGPRAARRRAVDQGREAFTAALGGVVEDDRLVPAQ